MISDTLIEDEEVNDTEADGPFGAQVTADLTEEEAYLFAILTDASGLDLAEFTKVNEESPDSCWRAYPYQWAWWRCQDRRQADRCARATGKSESIEARAGVFPFVHPGQEMVITAPEGIHAETITDRIEGQLTATRLLREMIIGGRSGISHKPFKVRYKNRARIIGRIPQKSGIGIKSTHPVWLELDEACFPAGTLILTRRGLVEIQMVTPTDEVWTHHNRWRPVLGVHGKGIRETVKVVGQGLPALQMTPNHRLWAQEATHWRKGGEGWQWRRADDMTGAYWSSPLGVDADAPPPIPLSPTNIKRPVDPLDPDFLFLVGLWIAEGSVGSSLGKGSPVVNRATWSVTPDEAVTVKKLLAGLGLHAKSWKVNNTAGCVNVVLNHSMVARWLVEQCGKGAHAKQVPPWVMGLPADLRRHVLDGLIYGDGFMCHDRRYALGRWKLTTVSRRLLVSSRLLAQSLGFHVSAYELPSNDRLIRGQVVHGGVSYQIVGALSGQGYDEDDLRLTKVRKVLPASSVEVFDLTVAEDASFVADGVVVHNSDYPERGWVEIRETLRRELADAQWRCHGVLTGVPNEYHKVTVGENSGFTVHWFTALHKPGWNDQEREEKTQEYGGASSPEYRRNIMGLPSDASNAIFVLSRLMNCVDKDQGSEYNLEEYWKREIRFETIEDLAAKQHLGPDDHGRLLVDMLDFPPTHRQYKVTWAGMDVGISRDPSEILVFGEYSPSAPERRRDEKVGIATPLEGLSRLKLLTRLHLMRFPTTVQVEALLRVVEFYRPKAFTMDSTGNGLGVLQQLQQLAHRSRLMRVEFEDDEDEQDPTKKKAAEARRTDADSALTVIKGYNFGGKVVVEIDEERAAELPPGLTVQEVAEKAGIKRLVKEYATDQCRELVDQRRALFPWDENFIEQMNGQTFVYSSEPTDQYGNKRRVYSRGVFHAFDGFRMAAIGRALQPIEQLLKAPPKKRAPVYDRFL